MTDVTALLHRAARHGISIVWDDKRNSVVIVRVRHKDQQLVHALDAHGSEIVSCCRVLVFGNVLARNVAAGCIKARLNLYYRLRYNACETLILWAFLGWPAMPVIGMIRFGLSETEPGSRMIAFR